VSVEKGFQGYEFFYLFRLVFVLSTADYGYLDWVGDNRH
jgi:hypothetical protein